LVDLLVKKAGHMMGYGVLMVLCYRAVGNWRKALATTILYACSDEFHQTFVPSRHGSILDVGVDTAGAVLGFALYQWVQKVKNGK
jgi:VanZ family protein